jgi:mono/diheme cytochrome c family protein
MPHGVRAAHHPDLSAGSDTMRLTAAAIILLAASRAAIAVETGDPDRGLAYARNDCAECHAVEPGEREGPYIDVPSFTEIANTPGISELALISFFQTPHPSMPDLIVASADIRDLIAYFLSLKER